jgi:hypothetical protein
MWEFAAEIPAMRNSAEMISALKFEGAVVAWRMIREATSLRNVASQFGKIFHLGHIFKP